MTSSPTTRNRLLKQGTGDNTNTWGDQQSTGDFDMIDIALDGVLQLTIAGNVSLTTASYVDDQARRRGLKITAGSTAAATITLPALEKWYLVWNASTFDQIIATSGGGASVTVKAGELIPVQCDAVNVARLTLLTMGGAKLTNLGNAVASTDAVNYGQMSAAISAAVYSQTTFGVPITPADNGKFLTNNGSTPSWAALTLGSVVGAGLATGGGSVSSAQTITVPAAAASDVRTGTDSTKAVTSAALSGSQAFITLTDAATVAWDASTGYNAKVTLGGNRVIGAPTNLVDGQTYVLVLTQDGAGSRIPTWNAIWDFGAASAPVLQTAAGKRDKVIAQYNATTGKLEASFWKGA